MLNRGQEVALVTDSACDLPPALAAELGVEMAPVHVILDQTEDLRDHIDISTDRFYEILLEGKRSLSTAAVNVIDFVEAYERSLHRGKAVLAVVLQPSYSVTFQNAKLAQEDDALAGRRVELEPGRALARQGLVVLAAAEAARAGAGMDELRAMVRALRTRTFMTFVSGGTAHLRRGGRLAADDQVEGSQVPVLRVGDKFELLERSPSREVALDRLCWLMERDLQTIGWNGKAALRVAIDEAAVDEEEVDRFAAEIRQRYPVERLYRWRVGPTAAAHLGPGTLGVAYQVAPRTL